MIRVKVKLDGEDNPLLMEIRGHALFAPGGSDIVCAAVSVLTQTIVFAMDDLLDVQPPVKMRKGFLRISVPERLDPSKKEGFFLLFKTLLLGLSEIAKSYPRHLSVQCTINN